jgi:hypothetical protein
MKIITIFGLIYSQHVCNFASTIKKYSDYRFLGLNKKENIVQGDEYYNQSKETFDEIYDLPRSRFHILDYLQRSILSVYAIAKLARKSDIVQFHYISRFVLPLAIVVKIFSRAKISSFIYGSDFLRANKIDEWFIAKTFALSDSIVCDSTNVLDGLKERFPKYRSIMCRCYFGSPIIDSLIKRKDNNTFKKDEKDRKTIMCGYNGAKGQQHIKIIDSLENVAKNYYWIFPMTYSIDDDAHEYIEKVRNYAEEKGLNYIILDSFLSEDEWIKYLQSTDVFIHMQVSDAFSSAISEHLLLGHILINGSWLPYKDLDDNGVFYISSNFEDLEQKLTDVIKRYSSLEESLKDNKDKIVRMKSLDYCIKNYWIPYFKDL